MQNSDAGVREWRTDCGMPLYDEQSRNIYSMAVRDRRTVYFQYNLDSAPTTSNLPCDFTPLGINISSKTRDLTRRGGTIVRSNKIHSGS